MGLCNECINDISENDCYRCAVYNYILPLECAGRACEAFSDGTQLSNVIKTISENVYEEGKASVKANHPIGKTLYKICEMITSGDIPEDVIKAHLGDRLKGLTTIEVMEKIRGEQIC